MRVKSLRLALIVVVPVVCLGVGVLVLRGGATPSLADGPGLSVASAWPPIPANLSRTGDKRSKVTDIEANANGILVVWSEGPNNPNGEVWMSWNDSSGWSKLQVDDRGEFIASEPKAVLAGTTAHFVWVGKVETGDQYCIFYRARDLATGAWQSASQQVYPASGTSSKKLGDARIAVDASGTPHVIWTGGAASLSVDRIFYSYWTGTAWNARERISGIHPDELPDSASLSQDMPAIVVNGNDTYVAWREKSTGPRKGIWVRHRTSPGGQWLPQKWEDGRTMGYKISDNQLDEFPAMAASGDRLYVMWDRLVNADCAGQICNYVYSMTYRVHTTPADVTAGWWPTVTSEPVEMVRPGDTPIVALSAVTTTGGEQVPMPDDYLSGARPQIGVTSAYTPYVVWHHWANEGHQSSKVDSAAPYYVSYAYVYEGDLDTALWEGPVPVFALGSRGIFASPSMVLAPGIEAPHDLHVALNLRLTADPSPWDVVYTNLGTYYYVRLPLIARN